MDAVKTFPDVEAVVATAIRARGLRTYSSVPTDPEYPLVTVKRTGGAPAHRRALDAATIELEIWGTTKSEAFDIAAECRTIAFNLEGTTTTDPVDAFISGVADAVGLAWTPDSETGRDRYSFSLVIYAY